MAEYRTEWDDERAVYVADVEDDRDSIAARLWEDFRNNRWRLLDDLDD